MKSKLKPYTIIILILCILVGIYFLWPIITDESDSVLAEGAIDGNSSISNVEQLPNKPIAYIQVLLYHQDCMNMKIQLLMEIW